MKHKTKSLEVLGKLVEIDVPMVPIIKWLNSFDGVGTIACCQGRALGLSRSNPYVFWASNNPTSIKSITDTFLHFYDENYREAKHVDDHSKMIGTLISSTRHNDRSDLGFRSEWPSFDVLNRFVEWAKLTG